MNGKQAIEEQVAQAIADAQPVDWRALEAAQPQAAARLRGLRLIESISSAHRALESSSGPAGPVPEDLAVTRLPSAAAPPARTWGGLELLDKLGEGGFGEVWRAHDPKLEREVALKLRHPRRGPADPAGSRFLDEARKLARVRHPNVAVVFGADEHDGREGLWTELVDGRTLEQCLADQGPFGGEEAAHIGMELCRALAAVHAAGLVHRDVKASNVMREKGGKMLLLDFGLVADLPRKGEEPPQRTISGTPLAMSPEALRGDPFDRSSDIYSLGVLLFHLVSGRYPVEADSWAALKEKHERGERLALRDVRPDLGLGFVQAVERALAPRPEERFPSAGAFEAALASAISGRAPEAAPLRTPEEASPRAGSRPRRHLWLAAAAAAAGLVAVGLYFGISAGRREAAPAAGPVPAPGAQVVAAPPATAAVQAPAAFEVQTDIFREPRQGEGGDIRLAAGARVRPGDRLFLEVQGPQEMHVYVLNEDEFGRSYVLFPLSGFDAGNPLRAQVKHRLPGRLRGEEQAWEVTSAGGKEQFLVVASRQPVAELEAELSRHPEAAPGRPLEVAEGTLLRLRGIGGVAPRQAAPSAGAGTLPGLMRDLSQAGGAAGGLQVRLFELENPAPGTGGR